MGLVQFSSVAQSCLTLCNPRNWSTLGFPVLHYLPEFAQTHVHWVGDAIQPSHPLSHPFSCLQSFPASGSFPMSQFFASGGQSIGVSASASVFPMNIQGWFPLGWTGWISLQSKGLSRVFSKTTVWKHWVFFTSNSHIYTWLLEFFCLGIFHSNCAIVHNAAINTSVHIFLYNLEVILKHELKNLIADLDCMHKWKDIAKLLSKMGCYQFILPTMYDSYCFLESLLTGISPFSPTHMYTP